jgi:hypothetical protein
MRERDYPEHYEKENRRHGYGRKAGKNRWGWFEEEDVKPQRSRDYDPSEIIEKYPARENMEPFRRKKTA